MNIFKNHLKVIFIYSKNKCFYEFLTSFLTLSIFSVNCFSHVSAFTIACSQIMPKLNICAMWGARRLTWSKWNLLLLSKFEHSIFVFHSLFRFYLANEMKEKFKHNSDSDLCHGFTLSLKPYEWCGYFFTNIYQPLHIWFHNISHVIFLLLLSINDWKN